MRRLVVLLFVIGLLIGAGFWIKGLFDQTKITPVITHFVKQEEIKLKQTDGRTNILLLGIGGGNHEGPQLTDSIIFASIDAKNKKVSLVSIPRDLWIPDLQKKINGAYEAGESNQKGKGLLLTKAAVQKVVGQPIHYGFLIDFSGFVKAIDLLDGIDVTVDRSLDDYAYPIEGKEDEPCGHTEEEIATFTATQSSEAEFFPCRYMHFHVDKGKQHMDGETALRFVRSRHGFGYEGSDFARSQRQAKVINAFRDKLFSVQTVLNLGKIVELYSVVKSSIDTDIPDDHVGDFVDLANKMRGAKITSGLLDWGDDEREGLLINPPSDEFGGAWVLVPKAGTNEYSDIHKYVNCIAANRGCPTPTPKPTKKPAPSVISR